MNFFEAQEFMQKMYPGKQISFEFDDNCHRKVEIMYTDGAPHMINHVECCKVKAKVEGMDPIYIPIQPHRFNTTWTGAKTYFSNATDVFIHDSDIQGLSDAKIDPEVYKSKLQELSTHTGLSHDAIEAKIK